MSKTASAQISCQPESCFITWFLEVIYHLLSFNRLEGFFVFYSLNQKSYLLMGFAIPHFIPWVLLATHGHYNRGG